MLRLTTLGAIDLRDRLGRPVRDVLSQPKRIALLVLLAIEGRRGPVPRDRILALFWPESDEAKARNALSQAVYHLRQALGAELIASQGATLAIAHDRLWCDAQVLEDALAAGDADLALDLYKGECCPALFVSGAPGFEEWLGETRRDQRHRLLDCVRRGVERSGAAGDVVLAARLARRALLLRPDDERDVRAYLTAVDRAGDATGALALYAEYARRLAAELETMPAPETVALVDRIKRRRSAQGAASDGAGEALPNGTPDAAVITAPDTPSATAETVSAPASPAPARGPARPASRARRGILAAVAVTLVAVWAISARARLGVAADPRDDPLAPSAIAVFPFTVRGGDPTHMLGDGVAVLLAAKLDGTDAVRAIDPRSATNAAEGRTPAPDHGAELSRALGARYYVLGDLTERAGRLQLDGALYETRRPTRALASASVTGDTTALFAIVDDLAGQLLANVLPGRDSSLTKLAAVTTSSLPALKAYLRGERAMRAGQDARAAAAFREAAMLDTTFALAQYRLALVANWISVPGIDDPVVWAEAAQRHDQRLTPLGRDLVEAFRAYKLPSSSAEARYRAIVQAYPDNVEAWYMYGEAQFHYGPILGRPATEARAAFERVLALDPANSHALVHLARLAALEGRIDELATLAARHQARYAEAERTMETRALLAWARHDSAAAAAILREAAHADPVVLYGLTQGAAVYSPNLSDARRLALLLHDAGTATLIKPFARVMLSEITLAGGRSTLAAPVPGATSADAQWHLESEVLAAVEPIAGASRERLLALRARVLATRPYLGLGVPSRELTGALGRATGEAMRLHLLGLLDVRLGDRTGARARLDSIEAHAGALDSTYARRLAISLRAELLRSEGHAAEALAVLERYDFSIQPYRLGHDGARERFARAELLAATGRTEEALQWYGSYPAFYDLAFLVPARFREAELLERAGDRAAARWRYAQVTELWRDADPEHQPLVRAARERLARLQ